MEGPHLTVMLTPHDITVPNAMDIFLEAKDAPADFWGFKDIGLPEREMRELVQCMKREGKTVFLESLAYTEEEGLQSARLAISCGFDYFTGTNFFPKIQQLASENGLRYLPFVGKRRDHRLYGEIDEIIAHAREVSAQGVYGINLSGFRYVGDAPALITGLVHAMDKPVSIVGSIDSYERLDLIKKAGPWTFTVGGAFFEGKFGGTFSEQIEAVVSYLKK